MNHFPALVLETSTPAASLALIQADESVIQREFSSDRSHNALLFNPLNDLLTGLAGEMPALVLVGSGPGSYSGTRVGIAAAQGVAIAAGCPAIAVPSLLAVPSAENGRKCVAIGDARRGNYWTALISDHRLQTEPTLTDAAGLAEAVEAALQTGITVFSFESPARFPLSEEQITQVLLEAPDATRLWNAWLATDKVARDAWAAKIPQPIYLAPPHITPAKRSWLAKEA